MASVKKNLKCLLSWIKTKPSTDTQPDGHKAKSLHNVSRNGGNVKKIK
jgi:hypothetical protein